ncbi:hypothetical protein ABE473_01030 [Stenotrophomonas sp. TWI700]|uniref:hypothetical protein n=1 Tax=Stenotrophomonas sp. TWI700 TaxID=3136792 RepID=UPI003208EAD8
MLKLRLAQRWERLGNRDADVGVMLLFALLAAFLAWGAYTMAYPEHGCMRMGKGNSGPLQCDPGELMKEAMGPMLLSALSAYAVLYGLWGWIKDMARPLTLDGDTASAPDADQQGP